MPQITVTHNIESQIFNVQMIKGETKTISGTVNSTKNAILVLLHMITCNILL